MKARNSTWINFLHTKYRPTVTPLSDNNFCLWKVKYLSVRTSIGSSHKLMPRTWLLKLPPTVLEERTPETRMLGLNGYLSLEL